MYYYEDGSGFNRCRPIPPMQGWSSQQQFVIQAECIHCDPRTTLMIRNIPNKYTVKELSEEIDEHFEATYDFLYLPCDLKVFPPLFRIRPMSAMALSMSSALDIWRTFTSPSKTTDGSASGAKK